MEEKQKHSIVHTRPLGVVAVLTFAIVLFLSSFSIALGGEPPPREEAVVIVEEVMCPSPRFEECAEEYNTRVEYCVIFADGREQCGICGAMTTYHDANWVLERMYCYVFREPGGNGNGNGDATPAPTLSFTADRTHILRGATSTLAWSVSNADSCSAACYSGSCAEWLIPLNKSLPSDTQIVTPTTTSRYLLNCTGPGGSATAHATIIVTYPPPVITSFTATPNPIIRGQTSTLSWATEHATACNGFCVSGPCGKAWPRLNEELPAHKETSGSEGVRPPTTATYRLECIGLGAPAARQDLTITVDFIRWREVIPRLFPFLDQMFALVSGTRMQEAK